MQIFLHPRQLSSIKALTLIQHLDYYQTSRQFHQLPSSCKIKSSCVKQSICTAALGFSVRLV